MSEGAPAGLVALLDPELLNGALAMRALTAKFTPMTPERLAMRRETLASMLPPLLPAPAAVERIIQGPAEAPDLVVWIVNARPGASRPGILHMHGGGFTASSARGAVPGLQAMAGALDCVIVSVEYRLAPEALFHQSLEDNHAALVWMHGAADELGIDPARIAIMGESGGGGHCALLALAVRDRGQVPVAFQILIYPMLDDRTGSSRRMPPHFGAFGWNEEANRFGWRCFLGAEPGGDAVPVVGVPARAENLAGLPSTFIGTGGLDLFVSEDIDFARRLNEAGVPTELLVVPGAYHGFDMIQPESAAARRFTAAKYEAVRRALG